MKIRKLLVLSLGLAMAVAGCAKKESKSDEKPAGDMEAMDTMEAMGDMDGMDGMDGMEPAAEPQPKGPGAKLLADPVTKTPDFKAAVAKIVEIGKACEVEKTEPYWMHSCKAFQAFQTEKQKTFEENAKTEGGKGMVRTWMLAGVDRLSDENRVIRAAGAKVIANILYAYHHASVKDVEPYRVALIESFKVSKDLSEKEHLLSLLANDGGTSTFQGGEETVKFISEVGSKDTDPKVRKAALQVLSYCVDGTCKVPAETVKTWFAAEQDADCKEVLVRIAAKVKLAAEVDAHCKPGFEAAKPSYGCQEGMRILLDESRFEATLALITALTQHAETKKPGASDVIAAATNILASKGREPWAKDKTRKLLEDVFASPDTIKVRTPYLVANLSAQVQMLAWEKADLQWAAKVLTREEARFSRAWKKDAAKDTAKAAALKSLKESRDLMKKRLAETK